MNYPTGNPKYDSSSKGYGQVAEQGALRTSGRFDRAIEEQDSFWNRGPWRYKEGGGGVGAIWLASKMRHREGSDRSVAGIAEEGKGLRKEVLHSSGGRKDRTVYLGHRGKVKKKSKKKNLLSHDRRRPKTRENLFYSSYGGGEGESSCGRSLTAQVKVSRRHAALLEGLDKLRTRPDEKEKKGCLVQPAVVYNWGKMLLSNHCKLHKGYVEPYWREKGKGGRPPDL